MTSRNVMRRVLESILHLCASILTAAIAIGSLLLCLLMCSCGDTTSQHGINENVVSDVKDEEANEPTKEITYLDLTLIHDDGVGYLLTDKSFNNTFFFSYSKFKSTFGFIPQEHYLPSTSLSFNQNTNAELSKDFIQAGMIKFGYFLTIHNVPIINLYESPIQLIATRGVGISVPTIDHVWYNGFEVEASKQIWQFSTIALAGYIVTFHTHALGEQNNESWKTINPIFSEVVTSIDVLDWMRTDQNVDL